MRRRVSKALVSGLHRAVPASRVRNFLGSYLEVVGYSFGLVGAHLDILAKRVATRPRADSEFHDWTTPTTEPVHYDREGAADWAVAHLRDPESIVPNCAYFVSDALRIGGTLPESERWRPGVRPGRIRRSHRIAEHPAYGCVGDLVIELQRSGRARLLGVDTMSDLLVGAARGDLIVYNWDGRGRFQHVAIVTAVTETATLVSQQTPTQYNRPWNRYGSGEWIRSAMLLRFATAGTPEVCAVPR